MEKKILNKIRSRIPRKYKIIVVNNYHKLLHYNNLLCLFFKNLKVGLIWAFTKNKIIKDINLYEQSFYSQNGEDGIIKIIFQKIKPTNKFCVEFGVEAGEGNCILLDKNGWNCLFMDGKGDGKRIKKEFITAENINIIFKKYKVPDEFDLLSIDIDSNDYWVWKALSNYSPRVVIIEYNAGISPTESKTITYDPNQVWDGTNYYGASLLALVKLGKQKGYTLIGVDNRGVNAFFVRNDLIKNNFKVKPIEEIYTPPKYTQKINGVYVGYPPSKRYMISV